MFVPLVMACFRLEWFPRRFKNIKTIILAKSRKKPFNYKTPVGYRLITLFFTIRKVIKVIITEKVTY